MGKQKRATESKGNDRVPVLYLRLTPDHEDALQKLIDRQTFKPERTTIGLRALEELLAREGLWPPSKAR